ncbi:MAG: sigma-70 family RNA polymerase sigma factor [Planctomycetes bacterium]|nr:sigma-70 family RNA polymerase sigma factor [Planctomycetota bacterium]
MDVPSPNPTDRLLAETGTVRRLAQALVRRSDLAHDVAQDVMLVALRQSEPPHNLRGWLAAVTRRLAGKAVRSQRIRALAEAAAAPAPGSDAEARTVERLRLHRRLTDAVLALPEPYRTVVALRFFDELPPRAIAQRLGTSGEVVRKRLQRGLELLRERLDADFGDRARWAFACAAFGLVDAGGPWLLLSVLAMNKLALLTAATLAVGVFVFWPDRSPPPLAGSVATADAPVPASVGTAAPAPNEPALRRTEVGTTAPPDGALPASSVLVIDASDRPVADAVVYSWSSGSQTWSECATDADGRGSLGAVQGPGAVLVVADGHVPWHQALAERRGEHRLVLPEGETIDGTLTVDGQPGVGFRLGFDSLPLDASVPGALAVDLRFHRGAVATTGRNGAFRCTGLPAGWQGTIHLPLTLWLVEPVLPDDAGRLPVAAPQRQIELHTTQLPTVRGRVVWRDTGEPAAWPDVTANAEFLDGQNSPVMGHTGWRDGTFALGFYGGSQARAAEWRDPQRRPAFRAVRLWVESADDSAEAFVELDAARLAAGEEVVVWLDRAPVTHFRCVDEADRPIAGARVKARAVSDPTDATGCGTFAGAPADVTLAGAMHHRIGPVAPRAAAAGTAEDPLVFVLAPTNVVRFRVEGGDVTGWRYRLRSDVAMFAGPRQQDSLDELLHAVSMDSGARGRTLPDGSTQWYDFYARFEADAAGRATVWSLEPGTPCEIQVLDDLQRPLVTARFAAPAFGAEAELVLLLPPDIAPFAGRVVDDEGRPVPQVDVRLSCDEPSGSTGVGRRTDPDGRFEFGRLGDLSKVRLELQRDGFVEQRHDRITAGALQTFTLPRGRDVTVQVVDEQGQPVDEAPRWRDDRREQVDRVSAGVYRFRGLPAGVATFACRIGADEFVLEHDTAAPVATLRVPRPGRVRFESPNGWPEPTLPRGSLVVAATCLVGGHQPVRLHGAKRGEAGTLLPGSWRFELLEVGLPQQGLPGPVRDTGLAAELQVTAGAEVTAVLR